MASADSFPEGFDASTYGSSFADVYDSWYSAISDPESTAAFLAARTDGPVLELGVGTGRLAAPLAVRGVKVLGIDVSLPMLRSAVQREDVVCAADMSALPFRPGFSLVFCAFNTLFNLPSADLQRRALSEAARVSVGGSVVIEAMTGTELVEPELRSVGISRMAVDQLVLSATVVDPSAQTITGQHVQFTDGGVRLRPWHLRWSTPAQLDEIAAGAGLDLIERFADWTGNPFGPEARHHVSVYRSR